jgi:hypothetical protein
MLYTVSALPVAPKGKLQKLHLIQFEKENWICLKKRCGEWIIFPQGGAIMVRHTTRVNPSEETIKIGLLGIRFLLTGDDSNGSVSVFEVLVHVKDAVEEVRHGPGAGHHRSEGGHRGSGDGVVRQPVPEKRLPEGL